MYLRHGAVVPHRVPISAQWKMNFWPAGVRVVRDFRAYEHFCNFYVFRNYQIDRTLVKRFLKKTHPRGCRSPNRCAGIKGFLSTCRKYFGLDGRLIRRPAKDARRKCEPYGSGFKEEELVFRTIALEFYAATA